MSKKGQGWENRKEQEQQKKKSKGNKSLRCYLLTVIFSFISEWIMAKR